MSRGPWNKLPADLMSFDSYARDSGRCLITKKKRVMVVHRKRAVTEDNSHFIFCHTFTGTKIFTKSVTQISRK